MVLCSKFFKINVTHFLGANIEMLIYVLCQLFLSLHCYVYRIEKNLDMFLHHLLDWFFFIFHLGFVIFNLTGWIWKKTRRINLITLTLTFASWFILGLFYGIGFCPLTEWHWQILEKLGRTDLPASYISYLINRLSGLELAPSLVDVVTVAAAVVAFLLSAFLNIRDLLRKK